MAESANVTPTLAISREDEKAVNISLPSGLVVWKPAFLKYDHCLSWAVNKISALLSFPTLVISGPPASWRRELIGPASVLFGSVFTSLGANFMTVAVKT